MSLPRLLITLGDVAGIGPEVAARAWPDLLEHARPIVIGDPAWLKQALRMIGSAAQVKVIDDVADARPMPESIPCFNPSRRDLSRVQPARISAEAGGAAYDYLCAAIDFTLSGRADGIVTCPLHKEGLHAAGVKHPGHTEILAERTGSKHFAMLLSANGFTVAHATLHMALRQVFASLTPAAVLEKIQLLDGILPKLVGRRPRIGVAALNPHASDGGLFGDEEAEIIRPAVETARNLGIDVSGPWPSDTLFVRAQGGAFDGIVAMYHDQGHIALKLLGGGLHAAVNITAGLPIVRTSVAHGTAYDIAWQGQADARGLINAVKAAAKLSQQSS